MLDKENKKAIAISDYSLNKKRAPHRIVEFTLIKYLVRWGTLS